MSKPPITAHLDWIGDLAFTATVSGHTLTLDSSSQAGPTPVEMLALSLAGCMSMDVVHILRRGRHPLTTLRSRIVTARAGEDPKRLVGVTLEFTVGGGAPREAIDRAVDLSREKYCSVWHSLRQDIELRVIVVVE